MIATPHLVDIAFVGGSSLVLAAIGDVTASWIDRGRARKHVMTRRRRWHEVGTAGSACAACGSDSIGQSRVAMDEVSTSYGLARAARLVGITGAIGALVGVALVLTAS
jgi:hypothetical protein